MTLINISPRRIYAYTVVGRDVAPWTRTVGAGTVHGRGLVKVGDTTRTTARERVREQLGTAYPDLRGVSILLDEPAAATPGAPEFRDHAVHRALVGAGVRRVEGEWFEATLDEVRAAIAAVRAGTRYEAGRTESFGLRPEQEEAVRVTADYLARHDGSRPPHFLWNAKMRFGKTFAAYSLARRMGWTRVLVLTYKPAVRAAWRDDLRSHVDFAGWRFVDSDTSVAERDELVDSPEPLVWFASFQDFSGRAADGGAKARNENLHLVDWDCVVVDEYHFGAWRASARELYDPSERPDALPVAEDEDGGSPVEDELGLSSRAYLYLSGTPFRAVTNGEFTEDQVFDWTYLDEQRAKRGWAGPGPNPYAELPAIEMYTYRLASSAVAVAEEEGADAFSLNAFFRASEVSPGEYRFADETSVSEFLETIRGKLSETARARVATGSRPPFPYEDARFKSAVRHSVWYLPDVASCHAMRALLAASPFFSGYVVHVAAGKGAGSGDRAKPPVEAAVREADGDHRSGSITLSCGKLMTGVTIREWSAILMLRSLKSPESYFQAAFRVQSPWAVRDKGGGRRVVKETAYVFEFDPNRALSLVAEYGTKLASSTSSSSETVLAELVDHLPIFAFDGSSMSRLDADSVLDWASSGIGATALAARWNSPLLIDISEATLTALLADPDLLASLEAIEDFRNLRDDVSKVVTSTSSLKASKAARAASGEEADPDERAERKETTSLRRQIREKLQKFVARVPVFMYLTDHRESSLQDLITRVKPELFERVTGLTIADFEALSRIGVFSRQNMDYAIYQFRSFENASLRYAEDPSAPAPVTATRIGLSDRTVEVAEYERELEADPEADRAAGLLPGAGS